MKKSAIKELEHKLEEVVRQLKPQTTRTPGVISWLK
jgi:hypothetical protein